MSLVFRLQLSCNGSPSSGCARSGGVRCGWGATALIYLTLHHSFWGIDQKWALTNITNAVPKLSVHTHTLWHTSNDTSCQLGQTAASCLFGRIPSGRCCLLGNTAANTYCGAQAIVDNLGHWVKEVRPPPQCGYSSQRMLIALTKRVCGLTSLYSS